MHALLADYDDDSSGSDDAVEGENHGIAAADTNRDTTQAEGRRVGGESIKRSSPSPSAAPSSLSALSPPAKKSRSLPPPPLHFLCAGPATATATVAASTSSAAQPTAALSDGRIRAFPHVEGNWPTHVFIPVPASPALSSLLDECDALLRATSRLPPFQRLPAAALHLSLSRAVPLRHHHIPHLTRLLTAALSASAAPAGQPLPVQLRSLALFCNEARTRSFAAVRVAAGGDDVLGVLRAVDGVMREMGLQTFYERPELHVTFAWQLGDVWKDAAQSGASQRGKETEAEPPAADEATSEGTNERDRRFDRPTVASCLVEVSEVHCKVGNRLIIIPLTAKQ